MMKKSQILAALALAMALGVVAPVAGASALTIEVKDNGNNITTHGKATCAEARTAVKYVEENTDYKNILAFKTAEQEIAKIEGKAFIDGVDHSIIWIDGNEIDAMVGAIYAQITATGENTTEAYSDAGTDYTAKKTIENAKKFIAEAKKTNGYAELRAIYDAVKSNNYSAYKTAAGRFNDKFRGADLPTNEDVFRKIKNGNTTGIGAFDARYAKFATSELFDQMDRADVEIAAYEKGFKALNDAYQAMAKADQLTTAGEAQYKAVVTDVHNKTGVVQLAGFAGIVMNRNNIFGATSERADLNLNNYVYNDDEWNAVTLAIDAIACNSRSSETAVYYNELAPLARTYITAAERDTSLGTMIKTMVAYAPQTPVVVPDADVTDAPASGVLGTAEGSATTVSIVAGLATALTALGAGVVAYRNARREK